MVKDYSVKYLQFFANYRRRTSLALSRYVSVGCKEKQNIIITLKPDKQHLLSVTYSPKSLAGMQHVFGKFHVLASS